MSTFCNQKCPDFRCGCTCKVPVRILAFIRDNTNSTTQNVISDVRLEEILTMYIEQVRALRENNRCGAMLFSVDSKKHQHHIPFCWQVQKDLMALRKKCRAT